jgi:hypothetical protein
LLLRLYKDDDDEEEWGFEPTTINKNGYYTMEENENGNFYPELKLNLENENDYDIKVEVPSNNENLVNKLIENNGTITVSNLMTTPNTKDGISKNSTLEISVNPYFPNNYQQTLNYVGYWKWDSTNQTFIQVLNNQDIIDGKYNLRIQPLYYDAETGLPQKVRIESGDTKRLKMVNDNNDGASEIMEYVENNTMVKFNSRTRSVTEYPYFEVEALPPTIQSPITSNGYYKFDGNTLISGDENDYNLNVNVESESEKGLITTFHGNYINRNGDTIYEAINIDCSTSSGWTRTTLSNISHSSGRRYIIYFGMVPSETFEKRLYFHIEQSDYSSSGTWTFYSGLSGYVKYYKTGTFSSDRYIGLEYIIGSLNNETRGVYYLGPYYKSYSVFIYIDALNYKFDDSFNFN